MSRSSGPQEPTPKRLPDMEPRHRRHVVLQAVLRVAVTWVFLVAVYYYVPPLDKHSSAGEIITLVIDPCENDVASKLGCWCKLAANVLAQGNSFKESEVEMPR